MGLPTVGNEVQDEEFVSEVDSAPSGWYGFANHIVPALWVKVPSAIVPDRG